MKPRTMSSSSSPEVDTTNHLSASDSEKRNSLPSSDSRPKLGSRKSSGTIIVPRDSPTVETKEEHYDEGDARAMSPRRSIEEMEKMGDEAREQLEEQAKALQANLLEIVDRVESVKSEHEKLEGGNKFLQSYIGELMQTSKITSSGAGKSKKGGKAAK